MVDAASGGGAPRPTIALLSLGGTIAMVGERGEGVTPRLGGSELVDAVPELAELAVVEVRSFRTVPSAHLSFEDLGDLAEAIDGLGDQVDGVVVTQGTDTLEETAFLLDLLHRGDRPVVVTGAMRNPTVPGADGPANVLAAVRVAASESARGLGVLVVMNDEIHAARFVRKAHTQNPAAFASAPGPLGWVGDGGPRFLLAPPPRVELTVATGGDRRVALLTVALADDGALLRAAAASGFDGFVVEAFGGGHVPATLVEEIERAATNAPLVLTSRIGVGELLRQTYGFPGSELDLLRRGVIPGGWLDGPKARVLLTVLLRAGLDRDEIAASFERFLAAGSA